MRTTDRRRILVLVTGSGLERPLCEAVRRLGAPADEVHVVAPALNGWLATWASDTAAAVRRAGDRLVEAVLALRADGQEVHAEIGDGNPSVAIEDALRWFAADAIVVAGEGGDGMRLAERARRRYGLPVTHVAPLPVRRMPDRGRAGTRLDARPLGLL